jgi:hypothetical protein
MYVAKQRLLIDGEWREVGEPVPELETWPQWETYLRWNKVEEVPDTEPRIIRRKASTS